jgi:hypothetical protein
MNKESRDMTEVTGFAQLATRAAVLADRLEAAGCLSLAASVRVMVDEVETAILQAVPPELPGWVIGRRTVARRPSVVRPDPGRGTAGRSRARSAG